MNNCRLLKMFESQEIKVEDFFVKLRFKERELRKFYYSFNFPSVI